MSEYNWTDFTKIKNDYDLNSIKLLFNSLKSLLNSISLINDIKILKSVSKRITIRLRSAKVSRLIKQTNKCFDKLFELKLSEVMTENLSSLVNENYDTSSGLIVLPFRQQIDSVLKLFLRSADILKKVILLSMNAFSSCYQWLRSGNLSPHFLMMSSCLSRLNFISKAIMVYINDLYLPLIAIKEVLKEKQTVYNENISFPESLKHLLNDLNIKCEQNIRRRPKVVNISKDITEDINQDVTEDIGVPIERSESKAKTQKNENKSKPKKKKIKNKLIIKPKQLKQKLKTKPQKQIEKRKTKRKN